MSALRVAAAVLIGFLYALVWIRVASKQPPGRASCALVPFSPRLAFSLSLSLSLLPYPVQ